MSSDKRARQLTPGDRVRYDGESWSVIESRPSGYSDWTLTLSRGRVVLHLATFPDSWWDVLMY